MVCIFCFKVNIYVRVRVKILLSFPWVCKESANLAKNFQPAIFSQGGLISFSVFLDFLRFISPLLASNKTFGLTYFCFTFYLKAGIKKRRQLGMFEKSTSIVER
ncbi:MAG: hypothetical protein CRN43_06300 [Candidatus Nephrothrix sp. EaCA]|nr:MAG: hypothetical protein CRN43_06300 [Candidatus Nephrothrix sp. EaCA]